MKAEILAQTDWLLFPLIAAVMFVAIFTLTVAWILRPGAREVYDDRSRMVFDDEAGRP